MPEHIERPLCQQSICPKRIDKRGIVCPFCSEDDFDLPGLKGHLMWDCVVYAKTETFKRVFLCFEDEKIEMKPIKEIK